MFLSSSLDVISTVVGSLKDAALPLIEQSNLISVITGCMEDNDDSVLQSAFGVLGDLAQYCYASIKGYVRQFVMLCVKYMDLE